jgi:hypothetical protein
LGLYEAGWVNYGLFSGSLGVSLSQSAALGCARPPARVSKKEAVTAGFRRKKQYHLEVETTSLAIYLTVGFRRKKQYHLEVETTLWRLQMNYIEKTML